ncbi:hypothetical protein EROM_101110 [Encephalitozoon romaleae SJ-2008]|uniref:Uncharacterized protein n=1 Tax=Encephalitozoon romaleae (strain SJ-2008) TaxID=1178016 RepID=I6ZVY8_ENCRO|nr:hypothetical protein EROM_101110 [Encephalitozoon romaleae SJ-2008]AFN83926.1 hypothetical protein EROM_101110 [Encephalitozoon romaleae SJ-2008]
MCSNIRIIERNNSAQIDVLLYDHVLAHIILDTRMEPSSVRQFSINSLGNNQNSSVKVFVNSRKVDFAYELILGYVLGCVGIEEYDCKVYLFDEIDDLCVLKNLIFAIDEKFNIELKASSEDGRIMIALRGKIVYETTAMI